MLVRLKSVSSGPSLRCPMRPHNIGVPMASSESSGLVQQSATLRQVHLNALVSLQAGWHTVRTRNHRVTWGENVYFICHSDGKENYPGRTLEVWDRGVNVG